jgi:hypothetical protein
MTMHLKRAPLITLLTLAILGATLLWPSQTLAESIEGIDAPQLLGEPDLEAIRGGFETDSGLQISFGIEQATSINGVLQTRTAFFVPSLTGDPSGITLDGWTSKVIQNGPGNGFTLNASDQIPNQVLTLVQNSLDQQVIQNLTVIDLTVKGLNLVQDPFLRSFLNQPRF